MEATTIHCFVHLLEFQSNLSYLWFINDKKNYWDYDGGILKQYVNLIISI